tara:strand:+ start:1823 stop:2119 length:297 start_codon:yes stop_codon:yes gene_type:complete
MNCKLGAVASNTIMWISGTAFSSQVEKLASIAEMTTEKDLYISLPVFIISLIASVGFTWTVARYDSNQRRMADEARDHMERLYRRLECIERYMEDEDG